MSENLHQLLGVELPIIQAPMAGAAGSALAAAVSATGALGSLGVGALEAAAAGREIAAVRARTAGPLNVNVFCHEPPQPDAALAAAWLARLAPEFRRYGAEPPPALREIYRSFRTDDAMLAELLALKPRVVSFHFGAPPAERIRALRAAGIVLLGCATSLEEARQLEAAGVQAVIAQGYEAGGHRGVFDPGREDARLGTLALTRLLVRCLGVPVIAAGGIMDGAGIAAVLRLGALAAQLGTAFLLCPESLADAAYRASLAGPAAHHTLMTRAISGRPARCLPNRFTALGSQVADAQVPAYPLAYDAGKQLHALARAAGEGGYGAHWAGQGAPLARALPAATLVRELAAAL